MLDGTPTGSFWGVKITLEFVIVAVIKAVFGVKTGTASTEFADKDALATTGGVLESTRFREDTDEMDFPLLTPTADVDMTGADVAIAVVEL